MVKAPLLVRRAILLFYTTSQAAPGLPCGSTQPAAVRASGAINPPLHGIRLVGPTSVFSASPLPTESLALRITTHPLPSSGECIFPGTISLAVGERCLSDSPLTTD